MTRTPGVHAVAPDGAPEIESGTDLGAVLLSLLGSPGLVDGDIVVVTSKVVSKAEGRVVAGSRDEHLAEATARVVARRGPTTIVRTHHGLTLAAAGIDNSNVALGASVLLPLDPDASARRLRAELHRRCDATVGVIVTDTAGRAWREGQTDIAIGAAGVVVAEDFAGRLDGHGNELAVTAPAVADEIAGLAELAQGKLGGRPFAVVRGRPDLVLARDDDGPGATALVRAEGGDLFGFGAREAVLRAVRGSDGDRRPFGAPVSSHELATAVVEVSGDVAEVVGPDDVRCSRAVGDGPAAAQRASLGILAFAHGWRVVDDPADASADTDLRFRPATP
jgi:coenzyme F420-0:L-glutamate ligase / coenzyme F420-1:gamma-L-glutamate ligase